VLRYIRCYTVHTPLLLFGIPIRCVLIQIIVRFHWLRYVLCNLFDSFVDLFMPPTCIWFFLFVRFVTTLHAFSFYIRLLRSFYRCVILMHFNTFCLCVNDACVILVVAFCWYVSPILRYYVSSVLPRSFLTDYRLPLMRLFWIVTLNRFSGRSCVPLILDWFPYRYLLPTLLCSDHQPPCLFTATLISPVV